MEIKTERPTCTDCGNYIDDHEIAIERNGELLCWHCLRKFCKEDPEAYTEWLLGNSLTHGYNFCRKTIDEERVVFPRGRDIA